MTRLPRFLLVLLMTSPLWAIPGASASCAAPTIEIANSKFRYAPGDRIQLRGQYWTDTCDDTGGSGVGSCGNDELDRGEPIHDIQLFLRTRGLSVGLVTVDADADFSFETEAIVPDVPPGRYFIQDREGLGDFSARTIQITR